ncbi:MAG: alpha-(1-_3)-arabinofuranosyltransferase family protein [Acidimicrobiales bacterium]
MRQDPRLRRRLSGALDFVVLGALAYVPLLLTKPGMVSSDTKQFLYLDPGRFLRQVTSMWDPQFAGGMVTHQYIGYLLPQGPFFWLFSSLGVPVWVAQRLWLGSLVFLAGAGVRYALRTLGLTSSGPLVAGVVYELSPYAMQYIERISAILMPWSGLGWMLGFTVLAIRKGGWKYPALFAIVVALAGGINATSLIYAGLAPLLWVLYSLFVTREAPVRRVASATLRIGLLSVAVSLWWVVGLAVEGAYGISVLKYTETLPAIAGTSAASEVTRGLGYWFFYGTDRLGPWLSSSVEYTQRIGLIAISFVLPALGFLGAVVSRWKVRAYFVAVALVGLVLSVGAHPYNGPSPLGGVLKAVMNGTTIGFALRSTDRATPLVVLALAALLGAGLSALHERRGQVAWVPAGLVVVLAIVNATPLITGLAVDPHFDRPSQLPQYISSAARYLDSKGNATRVLVEPGDNWADYTFGNTIDSIWSGILTRPSIQRQMLIDGSDQTADLLSAFDLTLQQGTYEPSTLAPIARLLSAGDVVLESDYKYWHYDTPAPQPTWALFDPPPAGIGKPVLFGKPTANEPPIRYALLDEQAEATSPTAAWPPPVAVFPVSDPRSIYRAEPATAPLVLDGSGAGIVAAAGAGLLDDNPTIIYAGSFAGDPKLIRQAAPQGAVLVLTDTNRKELRRWSSVSGNIGATLSADAGPQTADPTAQSLPLFASATNSSQTIATYSEARYVIASSYGNPIEFTPEDRPYMAFDGNPSTAWLTSSLSAASGQWLQAALDHPVKVGSLDLMQAYPEDTQRWITKATITFDGGSPVTVKLGVSSRRSGGQIVRFAPRSFSTIRITIDGTNWNGRNLSDATGVGFAEVGIPGVNISETMRLPSDLLTAVGPASLDHRLVILLTRDRVGPYPPRSDPELYMSRSFSLPTARTFAIAGTATVSPLVTDKRVDTILGGRGVFGGALITSNDRLPGDLDARSVFALDGNAHTAWTSGFGANAQSGAWMQASLTHQISFNHMSLQVVADGRHSVPTWIRITTNDHGRALVQVPAIHDSPTPGATTTVQLGFRQLTGSVVRVTVVGVRSETTVNWYTEQRQVLPFSIAEIGIPGLSIRPENPSADIPKVCRGNLMTIDGKRVWLKVTGTVGTAESGGGLTVTGCGPDVVGVRLGSGVHLLVTRAGAATGIDIDRLVLDSASGGGASRLLPDGNPYPVAGTIASPGTPALATPKVKVMSATATTARLEVSGATRPFWLVLGESLDNGWVAQIAGGRSLGTSTLIDGYANGWYVMPGSRVNFTVDLVWEPQKEVNVALVVSALAILVCLGLIAEPARRVRTRRRSKRERAEAEEIGPAIALQTAQAIEPEDSEAHFLAPWSRAGRASSFGAALATALVAGVVTVAVIPEPWAAPIAVLMIVLTLVSARAGRSRLLLAGTALVASVATGVMTVVGQMVHHFPAGSAWPSYFQSASIVAIMAFVALAADAAVETVRTAKGDGPGAAREPRDSTS